MVGHYRASPGLPSRSGGRDPNHRRSSQQSKHITVNNIFEPVTEEDVHQWRLVCLNTTDGSVIWNGIAHEGVPRVKRHPKASHCNSTPATDGHHIVPIFGSEGLFCFDMASKQLWHVDLGPMDSAFYRAPQAQWGFAASPVICDATHPAIAWSIRKGGNDMQTAIVVGNLLYACSDNGWLTCFDALTGDIHYRQALGPRGGFTASPVAAAGRLYVTSERGEIFVVAAGPFFRLLGTQTLGETCLATPAIVGNMSLFRTRTTLVAIALPPRPE